MKSLEKDTISQRTGKRPEGDNGGRAPPSSPLYLCGWNETLDQDASAIASRYAQKRDWVRASGAQRGAERAPGYENNVKHFTLYKDIQTL